MPGNIVDNVRVKPLHDTKANFEAYNPTLFFGEVGLEQQDDGSFLLKIGDGVNPWTALPYMNAGVSNARINESFHLIIVLKDGTEIDAGSVAIPVDEALSDTSTNPVQNKVVKSALATVEGKIPTVDSAMSTSSTNPVQNKVIKSALTTLEGKIPVVDETLSLTSTNPVQNALICEKLNTIIEYLNTNGATIDVIA